VLCLMMQSSQLGLFNQGSHLLSLLKCTVGSILLFFSSTFFAIFASCFKIEWSSEMYQNISYIELVYYICFMGLILLL
jgi:hypothetical protein